MLPYEVIARYFFIRPTIWAAELSQLCLIWGSMLALAHVLGRGLRPEVDAAQVAGDQLVEKRLIDLVDMPDGGDAGVVDEDVDLAGLADRVGDQLATA